MRRPARVAGARELLGLGALDPAGDLAQVGEGQGRVSTRFGRIVKRVRGRPPGRSLARERASPRAHALAATTGAMPSGSTGSRHGAAAHLMRR
jgi:hypothetical protein